MNKFYYANYETAKNNLNLKDQNEYSDRINLAYCNQLVKDVVVEVGISETEKRQYLETVVLKVFEKYSNRIKENLDNREVEMSGVYEAVKDAVVWG